MMIPAYTWWSLSIFTLDILAMYGLIAYGKRISSADSACGVGVATTLGVTKCSFRFSGRKRARGDPARP